MKWWNTSGAANKENNTNGLVLPLILNMTFLTLTINV
jgi:hypothetical protein